LQTAQAEASSQRLKILARTIGTIVIVSGFVLLWLTLASFL